MKPVFSLSDCDKSGPEQTGPENSKVGFAEDPLESGKPVQGPVRILQPIIIWLFISSLIVFFLVFVSY